MDIEAMTSASGPETMPQNDHNGKATYKSFKKKYRKMRIQFEEKMNMNQFNYREEQRASETARRLAIGNDQLLDLLLDVNSSTQLSPSLRFDIDTPSGPQSALPELIAAEPILSSTPEGQAIKKALTTATEARALKRKSLASPSKSLSALLTQFPPLGVSSLPEDQQADLHLPQPIAYLTPDIVDTFLTSTDLSLGLEIPATHINMNSQTQASFPLLSRQTGRELEEGNPNSVYGWLRANEPQVFLQDGEELGGNSGKVGSLRGAGKRGSLAHASSSSHNNESRATILKTEVMQGHEDEDLESEAGATAGTGSSRARKGSGGPVGSKRKRPVTGDDDSGGYRPKGGSRPIKKRKSEAQLGGGSGGSRKSTGKTSRKNVGSEVPAMPQQKLDEGEDTAVETYAAE